MKRFVVLCAVFSLALWVSPAAHAQTAQNQMIPGTQVRLTLMNGLSSSVAHSGDPFTAIVAEPVFAGNTMILPAGAVIHGTITTVERPKFFSMFRGGAAMNLKFDSIEVESRLFPAKMSILSIYEGGPAASKQRKDVKTVEGEEVTENHSIKTDVGDKPLAKASTRSVLRILSEHASVCQCCLAPVTY